MESYAERLSLALDEALWHLLYPDASAAIPAYWNKSLMNTIARLTDINNQYKATTQQPKDTE